MPKLEGDVAELYAAYVTDLGAKLEQVGPWWARLVAGLDRERLKLRWPGGPASHPRVIGLYREYHRRVLTLERSSGPGPGPRFDDDDAWGSEAEANPTGLIPPTPEHVLIDRLYTDAPQLHARMVYLVMSPVGELPDPRPTMLNLGQDGMIDADIGTRRSFNFSGRHDVERGVTRLLGAGMDLRRHPMETLAYADATEPHRLAFSTYLRDLEGALVEAERWWVSELARHEARGSTSEQALAQLYAAHSAGPVGHPRVLGVIQAYWALCHEINRAIVGTKHDVSPELLLLAWLREARRESWVEVLTALPYWPVGLDAAGKWV